MTFQAPDAESIAVRFWRGEWEATTRYAVGDMVKYGNGLFISKRESSNVIPFGNVFNLAETAIYWSAIAPSLLSGGAFTGAGILEPIPDPTPAPDKDPNLIVTPDVDGYITIDNAYRRIIHIDTGPAGEAPVVTDIKGINGGVPGQELSLKTLSSTRDVRLLDNAGSVGKFRLSGGNVTLNHREVMCSVILVESVGGISTGNEWFQFAMAQNAPVGTDIAPAALLERVQVLEEKLAALELF
jgi:hypothetical protein